MGITLKNNKSVTKNITIKGDNGVGIKTITSGTPVVTEEKTTTPITVTLTDETTQNFNVEAQNGSGADNALTKPITVPSATQIVAVDTTNSQKMLTIGDGLSIENDTLKANGGKLYQHNIVIKGNYCLTAIIITKNSDIFNENSLINYLNENYGNGFNSPGIQIKGGFYNDLNTPYELFLDTDLKMRYIGRTISINGTSLIITDGANFVAGIQYDIFIDTIIEL